MIIPITSQNEQFLSILLMKRNSILYYHKLNGEVVEHNLKTGESSTVFKTSILSNELDIAPGCSLKADREESDLFAMSGSSRISILKGIGNGVKFGQPGQESRIVTINGITGHPFGDFVPFGGDKVIVLCLTSMLLVYKYSDNGAKMMHHTLLKNSLNLGYEPVTNTFNICSKERYIGVSFHDPSHNAKDKVVMIGLEDVDLRPPKVLDVYQCDSSTQEIGSAF